MSPLQEAGRNKLKEVARAPRIAVLIPCYNEERSIGEVVRAFRKQLPGVAVHVFDNNSEDRTIEEARRAGAIISTETRQGKGYVVRSMFYRVEADVYVMVDGDGTYPPECVSTLIAPILADEADMVVGSRLHAGSRSDFKRMNRLGNRLFLAVLNFIFRVRLTDLLSGYRAFSRKFIKEIALSSGGFEIETELTIKALQRGYRIHEIPVNLSPRLAGSHSKIRHLHDGALILNTILSLFRDYKPLTFFGAAGLALILAGCIPGLIVIVEFFETGLVLRIPSAILAVGLVLAGMLSIAVGLTLHTIIRRFGELDDQVRRLAEDLRQRDAAGRDYMTRGADD